MQNGLERARLNEQQALIENKALTIVDNPQQADFVQIRLNPEQTSRSTLKKIRYLLNRIPTNVRIFNHPDTFHLCAEKHLTYQAWQDAELNTLKYDIWSFWIPAKEQIKKIRLFMQGSPAYFRTHNEDSGKGIIYLTGQETDEQLKTIIYRLRWRCITNRVSRSQALITAEVDNRINHCGQVFRVHWVNGKIIGGYALVGKDKIIHASDVRFEDLNEFVAANKVLYQWMHDPYWLSLWTKAMKTLSLDFGALEFFCVNNQPVFLEANPMWGGHHRFGNAELTEWLKNSTSEELKTQIPNIFQWLDSNGFYQKYWRALTNT